MGKENKEIIIWGETQPREETSSLLRTLADRFTGKKDIQTDLLLGKEELEYRLTFLFDEVMIKGEIMHRLDKNRFCRVRVADKKGLATLEFRIGSKEAVSAADYNSDKLLEVDTLIHVSLTLNSKSIFEAGTADLERQFKTLIGPHEYQHNHSVAYKPGHYYNSSVGTEVHMAEGIQIPINDETFVRVTDPINQIVWKLTKEAPTSSRPHTRP